MDKKTEHRELLLLQGLFVQLKDLVEEVEKKITVNRKETSEQKK